jgi:hypothetical protein
MITGWYPTDSDRKKYLKFVAYFSDPASVLFPDQLIHTFHHVDTTKNHALHARFSKTPIKTPINDKPRRANYPPKKIGCIHKNFLVPGPLAALKVTGDDAVFGAGGTHADDFLGSEIGGDEGQTADPGGDGAAGKEKVITGAHVALEGEADPQNEDEIDQHDEPVDNGQIHGYPYIFERTWIGMLLGEL